VLEDAEECRLLLRRSTWARRTVNTLRTVAITDHVRLGRETRLRPRPRHLLPRSNSTAAALHPRSVQNVMQSEWDFVPARPRPCHREAAAGASYVSGMSRTPTLHLDITGMQEEIDRAHENAAAEDFSQYGRRGRRVGARSEWGRRGQERRGVVGDERGRLRRDWDVQLWMCSLFLT
jgi:hypothetical protein